MYNYSIFVELIIEAEADQVDDLEKLVRHWDEQHYERTDYMLYLEKCQVPCRYVLNFHPGNMRRYLGKEASVEEMSEYAVKTIWNLVER